jgi:hypothetical protein
MECRKENEMGLGIGQEVELGMEKLEEFISGSEIGLEIIDSQGTIKITTSEQLESEIILDSIKKIYYIKNNNTVKILFKNSTMTTLIRI